MSVLDPITNSSVDQIVDGVTLVNAATANAPHNQLLQNINDIVGNLDTLNSEKVETSAVVEVRGTVGSIPSRKSDGSTIDVDIEGDAATVGGKSVSEAAVIGTIPVRNSSGVIFTDVEGDVTGSLTGNASSATTLSVGTDRNIIDSLKAPAFANFGTTAGTVAAGDHSHSLTPTGVVEWYAGQFAPAGYFICDGSEVSRSTYSALFAVIGTTFGIGDGLTTFNLPDLRGEFIRGIDAGRGIDVDRVLGSNQDDRVEDHQHKSVPDEMSQSFTWAGPGGGGPEDGNNSTACYNTGFISTPDVAGTETRPRNVALTPIIKH